MSGIDDLIATASARTAKVRVCARGDLVDLHQALVVQLDQQLKADGSLADDKVTGLSQQIVDVEAEMEASTVEITVTSVSQLKWANLLLKHPPTAAQRRGGHDHHPIDFPRAAVAACAVDPEISPLQAEQMHERLPFGEWTKLWMTVFSLNCSETPLPKLPAASELLRASAPSATPSDQGSLAEPSSAGSGAQ